MSSEILKPIKEIATLIKYRNRLPVVTHIFSKIDSTLLLPDLSYAGLIHFCMAL